MAHSVSLTTSESWLAAIGLTSAYAILLGVILACVAEIHERGKLLSSNSIQLKDAQILLHQFSEWWDVWSNSVSYNPEFTHDDLVAAFLRGRDRFAIPVLDDGEPPTMPEPDAAQDFPSFSPNPLLPLSERMQVGYVANPVDALEYATRWASMTDVPVSPEAIVEAGQKFLDFLRENGLNDDTD